ncbi:MAG: hypothetical protein R2716_09400 [Microthrixaceae bacterium]
MGEVMAAAVEQPGEENWAREYWQRRESKARSDTHAYVVRTVVCWSVSCCSRSESSTVGSALSWRAVS